MRLRAARERRDGKVHQFLASVTGYDTNLAFAYPVGIAIDSMEPAFEALSKPVGVPYRASTGNLTYDKANRAWLIQAASAAGVFGFAGTNTVESGAIPIQLARSACGFVSLLLPALEGSQILRVVTNAVDESGSVASHAAWLGYPPRHSPGTTDDWTLEAEPQQSKPIGNLMGDCGRPTWRPSS